MRQGPLSCPRPAKCFLLCFLCLLLFLPLWREEIPPPAPIPWESLRMEEVREEWRDGGMLEQGYAAAYAVLPYLSLEDKAGQVLLARCPFLDQSTMLEECRPGGYVLFSNDFASRSPEQVKKALLSYQQASRIPLLFSVDEEGGEVVRISQNPRLSDAPFPSPQELYRRGGLDAVRDDAEKKAHLLLDLGIHVNLGPVADVPSSPGDYIYSRSLGLSPELTGDYVSIVTQTMQRLGVSCTLKHFPGYGDNLDTHAFSSLDDRSLPEFRQRDFIPFRAGVEAGAEFVLVSHNVVPSMDPDFPASLSEAVHRILREELGFSGLILTDDLRMAAASSQRGLPAAAQAVLCGNDMVTVYDWRTAKQQIVSAVRSGELPVERLDRAVIRVLAWKSIHGLLPLPGGEGR